ncbi:MAG: phosphatidylserine decarboxylase [Pseudomonadota bacterium]
MSDEKSQFSARGSRPWARIGFDLEGIVAALAAWLVGLLLGAIWSPLFWIGAIAAVIVLFATRKQDRTVPDASNLVIAPCDGVVQSVLLAVPPAELRMPSGEHLRVRVSSSPMSPNTFHAPITGEIQSVIQEEPNPSIVLATAPDLSGLAVAHLSFSSRSDMVGMILSTGGFGPRLEVTSESGDAVRAGRVVGKRRLGGWCDIYLKPGARLLVREGQTLVGSETVLCRLSVEPGDLAEHAEDRVADAPEVEEVPAADDAEAELVDSDTAETEVSDTSATPASEGDKDATGANEDLSEEEISEMFEKLKQKADEASQ